MTIEQIVEEVIKQIKALENRKNMLLVINDETDYDALEAFLTNMDRTNLQVGIISYDNVNPAISILKNLKVPIINMIVDKSYLNWDEFLIQYDAVLISGIAVGEMYNLSVLNINGPFEKLVWDLLLSGKKVYGLKALDSMKLKPILLNKVKSLYSEMENMGIHWIGESVQRADVEASVVTGQHLAGYEKCTVNISKNAVVTPLAKDFAKKNKIQLVRK